MKKRLVLTIDETNEGKHGITLDDDDMCYGIKFDLDISCSASRLKEEIKPCVDKIKDAQIRERDIEIRREIIAAMIGDASHKDFIKRVNSIYNWIKEGKV